MLLQNHVPRPRVAGCGLGGALGIDAPIRTRVALGRRDCGRAIRLDGGGLAAAPATSRVRRPRVATDRKFVTIYDLAYVAPSRAFYDLRTSQQLRARRRRNAPPKPAAPGASHRRATCARAGAAMGLWRASAASSPHRKSNISERGSRGISFI